MKLHLGCFDQIKEGWVNIDIQKPIDHPDLLQWDLRNGLPPQCREVDYVYSSHFLEHLLWPDAVKLLTQCREVMVPGGTMRACIPDFNKLVTRYLEKDWGFFSHCLSIAPNGQLMEIINYSLYQRDDGVNAEHVCMYDADFAVFTLEKAGFKECGVGSYKAGIDHPSRVPYSLFVEGIK